MGRFIHLAMAAADEAMQSANYKVEDGEMAERIGVDIGSGIGGFDVIEREHSEPAERRPAQDLAVLYSSGHRQSGSRTGQHPLQRQRAERGHCTACTTSAHSIGDASRSSSAAMPT